MSRYYELDRLAGLDTMVLHFSNNSTPPSPAVSMTTFDGIPYVTVPRSRKKDAIGRAGRSPLMDKSRDFNVTPSLNTSKSGKPPISVYRDTVRESKQSTLPCPKPCRASTSFYPLPAVPSASLQLPSFVDFSFHTITPSLYQASQPLAPTIPSSIPLPTLSQTIFPAVEGPHAPELHRDPYEIPAFSHPNSPYVPWALPVRREILRPLTPTSHVSTYSGCYSRPLSRSGARAPEPMDFQERDTQRKGTQISKISKSWKSLKRVVNTKVKHVTKRVTSLKNSFQTVQARVSSNPLRRISYDQAVPEQYSPIEPSFPSPSAASFDSSHTTTLATWLAARRRESLERDYDPQSMMSLDEYERMGSWIILTEIEHGAASFCGVACETHLPCNPIFAGDQTTSMEHHTNVLRALQQLDTPSRRSHSPMSPPCDQSQSFPHLASCSPWPEPFQVDEDIRKSFSRSMPGRDMSPGVLTRRERDMSMPGGWTFGT